MGDSGRTRPPTEGISLAGTIRLIYGRFTCLKLLLLINVRIPIRASFTALSTRQVGPRREVRVKRVGAREPGGSLTSLSDVRHVSSSAH